MSTPLDQAERQRIRERVEKATLGPWAWQVADESFLWLVGPDELQDVVLDCHRCEACQKQESKGFRRCGWPEKADADFIAHARTDLPALLEALEVVEKERDEWKHRAELVVGFINERGTAHAKTVAELMLLRPIAEAAKRAVERYDRADAAQKGQGFVRAGIAEAMVDDLRAALVQAHPQDPEALPGA